MEVCVSESMSCSKVKIEEKPQAQPPEEALQINHTNSSLNKKNSIFSLTLDEFQYKSGKSFGSMNMDEFLNSVWNAEGGNVQAEAENVEDATTETEAATLIRQSSFTIPTPLCNKTVEEVWSEITKNQSNAIDNDVHELQLAQPQQTFGEMTLENFLKKAGVIQEASSLISSDQHRMLEVVPFRNLCGSSYPSESMCLDVNIAETGPVMGFELSNDHSNTTGNNLLADNAASMYHMFTQSGRFVGESFGNNANGKCVRASNVGRPKGRRRSSGTLEVAVERRQRRMIKNRESAARSRARKQAYTAELELELNLLREDNARLKQILVEAQMKRRQEDLSGLCYSDNWADFGVRFYPSRHDGL
ncbi:ABSCISIC ACID-INSENSITIVE 5-like protein 1 [Cornus florida]|uniref:ABSCISIC ACID-INSENSITIVE 5-like protein 1 n=1 Tax=Cornus florida TaxID=4283 RepID=UPI0028A16D0A|nr:ABSCISIC ACID-INSENSITIVE 5-like protein 1 [Cornus florida]